MQTIVTRDQALLDLHVAVCKVTFTKTNGESRTMYATLYHDLLPPKKAEEPIKEQKATKPQSSDIIKVWDMEKKDWRSFRLSSVTYWDRMILPNIDMTAMIGESK